MRFPGNDVTALRSLVIFLSIHFCDALNAGKYSNSTTSAAHGHSNSNTKSHHPTATHVTRTSTADVSSTITKAPSWGNQSIPVNTCSVWGSESSWVWTPCSVFAGTVQLSYFPEHSGNGSHRTTYYDKSLDLVLTSPSVYMIVNTITGGNSCGPLGPTYATEVISMHLTEVYTLQPYANAQATTRMGEPVRLTLSDLENCPSYKEISTTGAIQVKHPVDNTYNRCNPRLVFPVQLKRLGYPYWKHCGNAYYNFGIFDPPGAVPTEDSLFASTVATPILETTEAALPAPTAVQEQASITSPAQATETSSPAQVVLESTKIAVVASDDIPFATSSQWIASEGSSAVQVAGSGFSGSFYTNPTDIAAVITPTSIAIATIAGQVISAAPGDSSIIVDGKTITSGGAPITLSGTNNVVTLGSEGLVVQYPSGSVATYALPTPVVATQALVSATVAGIAVTGTIGGSILVLGSQTLSNGGAPVTLSNNEVVSLGSSGVVVQYPGGQVSTISLTAAQATSKASSKSADPASASSQKFGDVIVSSITSSQIVETIAVSVSLTPSPSSVQATSNSTAPAAPLTASPGDRVAGGSMVMFMSLFLTALMLA